MRPFLSHGLAALLAAAGAWFLKPPPPRPVPVPPPVVAPTEPTSAALLALTNLARSKGGLAPLNPSEALRRAAQGHADRMAALGAMAHSGEGDGDIGDRVTAQGYRWSAVAENVGLTYGTPGAMEDAWEASPRHRANVLNPAYRDFGAAVAWSKARQPYWCAVFGATR